MNWKAIVLVGLWGFTGLGCGSSDPAGTTKSSASLLDWQPCPLTEGAKEKNPRAQCVKAELPLRWEEPDGKKIKVFVKRLPRKGATNQLWLLMGEPGNPATDFEQYADTLGRRANADIYMIDHRGVGRSEPFLKCPTQELPGTEDGEQISAGEMPSCAEHLTELYGDDVTAFTITNAAHDVGALIDLARDPERHVLVYGVSYGTYWAQRYLELYPAQADGLVLDSLLATPAHMPYGHSDQANKLGLALFDMCGADPLCSSKLGKTPNAVTEAAYQSLKDGKCAEAIAAGATIDKFKSVLGFMVGDTSFRGAAPSLIYRLNRCAPGDVAALQYFWRSFYLGPFGGINFKLFSWVVSAAVERSEMWQEEPMTVDDFVAHDDKLLYTRFPPKELVASWLAYPFVVPHDEHYGQLPETSVPILAMTGLMDINMSIEMGMPFGELLTKPHQQWIHIPRAGHIVLASSPMKSEPGETCGLKLAGQFFLNPTGDLDTSCVDDVEDIDFKSTILTAQQLYHTDDLYE